MRAPTYLFALVLLFVPLGIWIERHEPNIWNHRLWRPLYLNEPSFHTPLHSSGAYLPAHIDSPLTLSPSQNPVILAGTVYVAPEATLTILPGTEIYTNEFSRLFINGRLEIQGTSNQPVIFNTNEIHLANQSWLGITLANGSTSEITYARLHAAVPGVNCELGSRARISNSVFYSPILAVSTASPDCQIRDSRLVSAQDGVHAYIPEPPLHNIRYSIAKKTLVQY